MGTHEGLSVHVDFMSTSRNGKRSWRKAPAVQELYTSFPLFGNRLRADLGASYFDETNILTHFSPDFLSTDEYNSQENLHITNLSKIDIL